MYRVWNFITTYSILLISGALIALVWANIDPHSYHHVVEYPLWFNGWIGIDIGYWEKAYGEASHHFEYGDVEKVLTFHYLINDMLMALFFAIAGKEVWEAVILKNGSLRGKKAATPLVATAGGMLGPIAVYLGIAYFLGSSTFDAVSRGWAIPTATDIAFSYLVGRLVFGAGHPAVRFLLLLAIADDAAGLIILAIFYPSGELAPEWLLLSVAASVIAYVLFNWLPRRKDRGDQLRRYSTFVRKKLGWIPYAIAGCLSWYGFAQAGIHPALGLLPVIPAIPHADRAFGIFSEAEKYLTDTLNQMEHSLAIPVDIVLFFFGLLNAGVEFGAIGEATWLVLAGLIIGKPIGVFIMGWIAVGPMRLGLPAGMRLVDLVVIGFVAAIGFTVSLFVASVAFAPGPVQDAAKMGALFSFGAVFLSFIAGKLLRVEKQHG
ncbi:Na+/H+ antiporter NhaA [Aliiroseovarius sp. S1123]|jgi:NhaA family Na+:H+ antiporter|uniref:Na+/H+ antiporter NhaA n=1 Tax=unclassified Aliiroseovarius TaxID=2623558 RepID=UPI001FF106DF|nr:Na+/H+ antiporter NhaA [Aliiroseovarius sp. S1123]MCK0169801.1 Na+/H+ antiporter NhaA [Aliiroseovarius sp. S1123]